jgi:LmbE family N-acetylglucosaminyl deacetylase
MNFRARTLVVVAHPDDEVLGCGATMARIASEGGIVQTIFLADGETSRFPESEIGSQEALSRIIARKIAAGSAAKVLGSLPPKFFDLPDNRLDSLPILEITKIIENEIAIFKPSQVITHFSSDLNIDHRKVNEAVLVASRPQGDSFISEVICFELPSSTEWRPPGSGQTFSPNLFVDVAEFESQKLSALNAYQTEMRAFPHPRSKEAILSLMKWRGASSNLALAEAFMLARGIL